MKRHYAQYIVYRICYKLVLQVAHTSISICGGKGINYAHEILKGLPIGVYVTEIIMNDFNAEQKKRAIPVRNENNLFFIMQKCDIFEFLPIETFDLLKTNPNSSIEAIQYSLKAFDKDEDALQKLLPWILIHLGRKNEIIKGK